MGLSERALSIAGSLTLEIDARAKQMKAEGKDVVGFGAGEPDFDTPNFIKEAAKEALDKGMTKYTPASGSLDYKKAICRKLLRDSGLEYQPSQIIISNGAKHSLFNTFQAILNPGDEVIIPSPFWLSYPEMVKMADGKPVFVETGEQNGFKMSAAQFEAAITPKTKAIVINSPSNPCGSVYSESELRDIAAIALEKRIFVVSDEIYEHLIYDGEKAISIASLGEGIKDLTIIVNGMSKAYAMTGWRLGYTASRVDIAKVMGNYQSHATSNPNSIAQHAGMVALDGPEDAIKAMVKEFDARRKLMYDTVNSIDNLSCIMPKGAFYIMVNISGVLHKRSNGRKIRGSMDFASSLLESKNVTVVPGVAFGADNFIRLSYATSRDNIEKGLARIQEFVKELE
ncbi:MAG: pyridoxal phosphate-dependent aminotransferase [Christensenellales bacterium]